MPVGAPRENTGSNPRGWTSGGSSRTVARLMSARLRMNVLTSLPAIAGTPAFAEAQKPNQTRI